MVFSNILRFLFLSHNFSVTKGSNFFIFLGVRYWTLLAHSHFHLVCITLLYLDSAILNYCLVAKKIDMKKEMRHGYLLFPGFLSIFVVFTRQLDRKYENLIQFVGKDCDFLIYFFVGLFVGCIRAS